MDQEAIIQYISATFAGVNVLRATEGVGAGDTFFIYDPERNLEAKQQFPFTTIVTKNYGDFDNKSNLDRPGVFRLNIGVRRVTFQSLFGTPASSPDAATCDFAALDHLMPHPVYAPQSWVCVLNPSAETFESLKPLLAEAYDVVFNRQSNRQTEP
jgi:hypothetical protein